MDNLGKDFKARFLDVRNHRIKSASMLKRAIALVIDIIIINIFIAAPFKGTLVGFMEHASLFQTIPDNVSLSIFYIAILSLFYLSLFQYYFQQTIGMMVMKLYTLPKVGLMRCLIRNLFVVPFFPFSILWIVEPIYLHFRGVRWLERITGTITVEASHG